ncbi:M14 family metallopeptidase [Peribacillus sp. SCS-37]|uniref:M14 family metallopeptidase n=1 Tax=Paraperibacillus esterisolvens TaxID=3115296 RepID=UPI003905B818
MLDLKKIWTCDGFLLDANEDSVPDGIRIEISGIHEACKPEGLIDFYARLGLETTALSFPFIKHNNGGACTVAFSIDTALKDAAVFQVIDNCIEASGGNEEILSGFLRWVASSWPYDIPEEWIPKEITRIEWTEKKYRVSFSDQIESEWVDINPLSFTKTESTSLGGLQNIWTVQGFFQGGRVDLNSQLNVGFSFKSDVTADVLIRAAEFAARIGLNATGIQFPITGSNHPELDIVIELTDSDSCQVSWELDQIFISGGKEAVKNALSYFACAKRYEEGGTFAQWEQAVRQTDIRKEPLVYEKYWQDHGEKEDLLLFIKSAEAVDQVRVFISEPASIRRQLVNEIKSLSAAEEVEVLSAFKPGYFWIEEEIMPLLQGKDIDKIHIVCKRNKHGLELANRWIQELYPIDEILGRFFSISSDLIEFFLEDIEEHYIFKAFDHSGECILEQTLKVPTVELDYIDDKNKVYPTTGLIQLYKNGSLVREIQNPTDRERFWQFFLNELREEITPVLPLQEEGRGKEQPFFSRLHLEISMSEEERKLGIEEERISPLEALHEDIYFGVLDYFEHLGEVSCGQRWDAPGGVHPFLDVIQGGKPFAKIKLYGFIPEEKVELSTEILNFTADDKEPVSCIIQTGAGNENFYAREQWCSYSLPEWNENVSELASLGGVNIWLGGTSYEGRAIPVLEVIKPSMQDFYSSHKLSLYKPTILIETGHHANEVSSSPAASELVKEIIAMRPEVLNSLNIIVIPGANPDGSHLHSRLTESNPEWKHHAARYNAVGLEFAHVRYKKTIFGEAEVVPNIINRWLPDVYLDGHGIPGHEWIQPFSGFNSPPRFPVSYSIPSAFIYGITKELDKTQYPEHQTIQDYLIKGIIEKINRNEAIQNKNEYWRQRYFKYGTNWLPEVFPIEQENGMNFYRWDTKADRESSTYLSRYPEWCSAEFITEAADETVYGETLAGCVLSQKSFYLGLIERMAACTTEVKRKKDQDYIKYYRKRPLQKG